MKTFLVVEYLISLPHATKMMKKLSQKKHAAFKFHWTLDEVDSLAEVPVELGWYDDYLPDVEFFHLKVFRDIGDDQQPPLSNDELKQIRQLLAKASMPLIDSTKLYGY